MHRGKLAFEADPIFACAIIGEFAVVLGRRVTLSNSV